MSPGLPPLDVQCVARKKTKIGADARSGSDARMRMRMVVPEIGDIGVGERWQAVELESAAVAVRGRRAVNREQARGEPKSLSSWPPCKDVGALHAVLSRHLLLRGRAKAVESRHEPDVDESDATEDFD